MKEHFCPVEQAVVSFEVECNWCGEKEMKTIIEMAREATGATGTLLTCSLVGIKEISDFAALVREEEREACAKWYESEGHMMFPVAIPKAIRSGK